MPLCTQKGPDGFQDHGTRGWSDDRVVMMPAEGRAVTPGGAEGADAPPQRLRLRMGRSGLVMGTRGGGSAPVTLGLSLGLYDSPSTTRS
jgi:hypothetical protein